MNEYLTCALPITIPKYKILSIICFFIFILLPIAVSMFKNKTLNESKGINSYFKNFFNIDGSKRIMKHPLFYLLTGLPISLFVYSGVLFWSGCSFKFSAEGIDTFFVISKYPFWILSTIAPLTYLFIKAHSSAATELRIDISQKKTMTELYLTHREFFIEYLEDIEHHIMCKHDTVMITYSNLYKEIFRCNSFLDGLDYPSSKKAINYFLDEIMDNLKLITNDLSRLLDAVNKEYNEIAKTFQKHFDRETRTIDITSSNTIYLSEYIGFGFDYFKVTQKLINISDRIDMEKCLDVFYQERLNKIDCCIKKVFNKLAKNALYCNKCIDEIKKPNEIGKYNMDILKGIEIILIHLSEHIDVKDGEKYKIILNEMNLNYLLSTLILRIEQGTGMIKDVENARGSSYLSLEDDVLAILVNIAPRD